MKNNYKTQIQKTSWFDNDNEYKNERCMKSLNIKKKEKKEYKKE